MSQSPLPRSSAARPKRTTLLRAGMPIRLGNKSMQRTSASVFSCSKWAISLVCRKSSIARYQCQASSRIGAALSGGISPDTPSRAKPRSLFLTKVCPACWPTVPMGDGWSGLCRARRVIMGWFTCGIGQRDNFRGVSLCMGTWVTGPLPCVPTAPLWNTSTPSSFLAGISSREKKKNACRQFETASALLSRRTTTRSRWEQPAAWVRFFDRATGRLSSSLPEKDVQTLAIAPAGLTMVTTIQNQLAWWDLAEQRVISRLEFPNRIRVPCFSHDGKRLALTVDGHGIYLGSTDLKTMEPLHFEHGFEHGALAFSPDDRTLAVGCHDGTVCLLDVLTREERRFMRPGNP